MVSLSCIQHIFQILSLNPTIGWGYGPVYLTHVTHPVIVAQPIMLRRFLRIKQEQVFLIKTKMVRAGLNFVFVQP
jgi:hypothetical protein